MRDDICDALNIETAYQLIPFLVLIVMQKWEHGDPCLNVEARCANVLHKL